MDFSTILTLLQEVQKRDLTREELNSLIKRAYQISISCLKANYNSKLHFLRNEENALEDMAMDSIVPLFVKNSNDKLGIMRSLEKWNDTLDNAADADYFLSRIIWRRVDQTVTDALKERDPVFGKIIKTLNHSVTENDFRKVRYFGTLLITQKDELKVSGKIINQENFDLIPDHFFGLKQKELFTRIFEYLVNETYYHPAIPLNLLVKRVKRYYMDKVKLEESYTDRSESTFAIDSAVKTSLQVVRIKLESYYGLNNKLNPDEINQIYFAFENISKDMMNGGMEYSLFNYLKDFNKTLNKDLFYSKYHRIMNYLLSCFKQNLITNLHI